MDNDEGCAICGATWGNYIANIDGKDLFFCCEICAKEYISLIDKVKQVTKWKQIERLEIGGDYRGRIGIASSNERFIRFYFSFNIDGSIREFVLI